MEIKPCKVRVTSEKEFNEIERICFADRMHWFCPEKDKYNSIRGDFKAINLHSDGDMCYTNVAYNYISFSEFVKRYRKAKSKTYLRDSLFKKVKMKLSQSFVL